MGVEGEEGWEEEGVELVEAVEVLEIEGDGEGEDDGIRSSESISLAKSGAWVRDAAATGMFLSLHCVFHRFISLPFPRSPCFPFPAAFKPDPHIPTSPHYLSSYLPRNANQH